MDTKRRPEELPPLWRRMFVPGEDVPTEEAGRGPQEPGGGLARHIKALPRRGRALEDLDAGARRPPALEGPRNAHPGTTLAGRYRLVEPLGGGGFGQVWKGYDLVLRRFVAVKVARKDRAGRPAHLLGEARRAASLRHPGIVPVFDVGKHCGSYFMVCELVDGIDLGERLRQGRLPALEAVHLVAEVADALDYAHHRGVVHRDIKPGNILVGVEGRVHLTDFGIALVAWADGARPAGVCGTPGYMSPEQHSGDPGRIDGRSDIYSLGVTLGELLTGSAPPHATATVDLRAPEVCRGGQTPPPAHAAIPECVSAICRKCLSARPADRYLTAKALAEDLRRVASGLKNEGERSARACPPHTVQHFYDLTRPASPRANGLLARSWDREIGGGLAVAESGSVARGMKGETPAGEAQAVA